MTRPPEPRPALQRAADGALHPAAPKAEPPKHLHPAPHAPAVPAAPAPDPTPVAPLRAGPPERFKPGDLRARKAGSGKGGKPPKPVDLVDLGVKVPKKLRKAVRRKAEAEGWSTDDAVAYVLRAWAES